METICVSAHDQCLGFTCEESSQNPTQNYIFTLALGCPFPHEPLQTPSHHIDYRHTDKTYTHTHKYKIINTPEHVFVTLFLSLFLLISLYCHTHTRSRNRTLPHICQHQTDCYEHYFWTFVVFLLFTFSENKQLYFISNMFPLLFALFGHPWLHSIE